MRASRSGSCMAIETDYPRFRFCGHEHLSSILYLKMFSAGIPNSSGLVDGNSSSPKTFRSMISGRFKQVRLVNRCERRISAAWKPNLWDEGQGRGISQNVWFKAWATPTWWVICKVLLSLHNLPILSPRQSKKRKDVGGTKSCHSSPPYMPQICLWRRLLAQDRNLDRCSHKAEIVFCACIWLGSYAKVNWPHS